MALHGTIKVKLTNEMKAYIDHTRQVLEQQMRAAEQAIEQAVQEEREACAQITEERVLYGDDWAVDGTEIAEKIRARGQEGEDE